MARLTRSCGRGSDLTNARCYRTTLKDGPAWCDVVKRLTVNANILETIKEENAPLDGDMHAQLPCGETDIYTFIRQKTS